MPKSLRALVIDGCHDLPASGSRLAFKGTIDKVRDRYWWPTMHSDVAEHVESSLLVNTAKHLTDLLRCLQGTDR